jgi:hypothetical protein
MQSKHWLLMQRIVAFLFSILRSRVYIQVCIFIVHRKYCSSSVLHSYATVAKLVSLIALLHQMCNE